MKYTDQIYDTASKNVDVLIAQSRELDGLMD